MPNQNRHTIKVCILILEMLLVCSQTLTLDIQDSPDSKNEKSKPQIETKSSPGGIQSGKVTSKKLSTIEKFVKNQGYTLESHIIVTEDNYVLMYHRIPGHLKTNYGDNNPKKKPILLQHGFLSASGSFMTRKGSSLAFALVDKGYDVWMGNARGNMFSRMHRVLKPNKDDVFWEFSFHEMGYYDLPAGIDYILNTTKLETLSYVGFSMGTTIFFVMGATQPDYMSKIDIMVAIAPVCRPVHMSLAQSPVLFWTVRLIFKILTIFRFDEMFPHSEVGFHYVEILCNPHKTPSKFCIWLLELIMGKKSEHHDASNSVRRLLYFPAGTSIRTHEHFLQIARSGIFRQYDYGRVGNWRTYHQVTPPEYDLKKVTATLYFIWSDRDTLAVKEDVEWLMDQLPTKPSMIEATYKDFSHGDFMHGKFATDLLHDQIIQQIFYAGQHGDTELNLMEMFTVKPDSKSHSDISEEDSIESIRK